MKQNNCTVDGCHNKGKYCRIHLRDEVKEKQPIDAFSDKRKKQENQWHRIKVAFLRENPICAEPECNQPATDAHHPGGRIGNDLLKKDDLVPFCRKHHRYYELRPIEAKEKGFSKYRLSSSKLSQIKVVK